MEENGGQQRHRLQIQQQQQQPEHFSSIQALAGLSLGLSIPARNTQAAAPGPGDWYELRPGGPGGGGPFRGVPPRPPPPRPRDVIQCCRDIHSIEVFSK